jgi:hypothetical protein
MRSFLDGAVPPVVTFPERLWVNVCKLRERKKEREKKHNLMVRESLNIKI